MIKQLQLRGISRSPSDRASLDGGCAESLNIHLEEGESAPTLPAQDLKDKLQWTYPDDVEYIYIHKGQGYEKYIYVDGNKVKAVAKGITAAELFTLEEGEEVIDVSHVGNTLVIVTNKRMQYALHRDGEYINLGDHVPLPIIEFKCNQYTPGYGARRPAGDTSSNAPKSLSLGPSISTQLHDWTATGTESQSTSSAQLGRSGLGTTSSSQSRAADYSHNLLKWDTTSWDKFLNGEYDTVNNDMKGDYAAINDAIWSMIKGQLTAVRKQGYFGAPAFVRYALRLYDGSYIYQSVPILIGAGDKEFFTARGRVFHDVNNKRISYVEAKLVSGYKVYAYLKTFDYDGWDDIVESIDIFMSTDIYNPQINEDVKVVTPLLQEGSSEPVDQYFELSFSSKDATEQADALEREVLSKRNFYKVASFKVGGTTKLENGYDLANLDDKFLLDTIGAQDYLVLQEELPDDYQSHHRKIPDNIFLYNHKLVLSSVSQEITRGYPYMCGATTRRDFSQGSYDAEYTYALRFYLHSPSGEPLSVYTHNINGGEKISVPSCQYYRYNQQSGGTYVTLYGRAFAWIAYPDPRCYRVDVFRYSGNTIAAKHSYEMQAHPGLNCSYAFVGLDGLIADTTNMTPTYWGHTFVEKRIFKEDNIIWSSLMDNPFNFPVEGKITFNSTVIGLAAITAPLSTGQAGQFDMYVFTEEGIYALKNNTVGDFMLSHMVSREVAVNPNILGFEQAVVFVSDKGVMLINGGPFSVTNLSPDMNGRHYTLETDVATLLSSDTNWNSLLSATSDNTPFMAFMRSAEIAYDYKGGRLIFFNDSKPYQYVYMFGTNSWHKLLGGSGDYKVLNSYPDCMVTKEAEYATSYVEITISEIIESMPGSHLVANAIEAWFTAHNVQIETHALYDLPVLVRMLDATATAFTEEIEENYSDEVTYTLEHISAPWYKSTLLDYSTALDDVSVLSDTASSVKGMIVTRPFDLGEPDIRKSINSLRIRGQYNAGDVKYILCGSMDGHVWKRLTSLRGGSYKLFRLVILANLAPTERITWVDVDYESRFNDKLR